MIQMNKSFSSFSQMKALTWPEQIQAILNNDFLPPIGAVIDLTNICNLKCYWCNAQSFRDTESLDYDHVMDVLKMLKVWGVRSVCFAGGGEPSLWRHFATAIRTASNYGLSVGVSTNGIELTGEMIKIIGKRAKFCGFSIDAGSFKTWSKLKCGMYPMWLKMQKNAKMLSHYKKLDLTYKMLVTPENQTEIIKACRLAKRLGFNNFYCRFPAFENVPSVRKMKGYNRRLIDHHIRQIESMENANFHVYANVSRGINEHYKKNLTFKKCRCTPLVAVFCADGWCYPCIDYRGRKKWRMCRHLQLNNFWNSKGHKSIISKIDVKTCPRCAFTSYNEIIDAYEMDYMFMDFP